MGVTKSAADAYTLFKKIKKIRTYQKLVVEAINEDTRDGALMKLGVRGMLDVAGKALGTSLTSHPYFTYHKAHLEALAQALNASSDFDAAKAALNRAISSADSAASLTKSLADYKFQKNGLKVTYTMLIAGELNVQGDSSPAADLQLKQAGQTRASLQSTVDQDVYEWRANWCDLYQNCVELLAMAQMEYRAADAAMQKYNQKMKALKSGGNIGRVFGYRAEEDRQWQEYDRMTKPGSGNVKAVEDPAGYAKNQVDSIDDVASDLGQSCEVAMSDDAYRPNTLLSKLGSL